jgi:hypothetical protein
VTPFGSVSRTSCAFRSTTVLTTLARLSRGETKKPSSLAAVLRSRPVIKTAEHRIFANPAVSCSSRSPGGTLTANTAAAGTEPKWGFTIGSWRATKARADAILSAARNSPGPAGRSASFAGQGTGQAICAERMSTPVGVDRKSGQRRDERPAKCVHHHRLRKYIRQSSFEALEGSPTLFSAPFRTRHNPSFPTFRRRSSNKVVNGLWTQGFDSASEGRVHSGGRSWEPAGQVDSVLRLLKISSAKSRGYQHR